MGHGVYSFPAAGLRADLSRNVLCVDVRTAIACDARVLGGGTEWLRDWICVPKTWKAGAGASRARGACEEMSTVGTGAEENWRAVAAAMNEEALGVGGIAGIESVFPLEMPRGGSEEDPAVPAADARATAFATMLLINDIPHVRSELEWRRELTLYQRMRGTENSAGNRVSRVIGRGDIDELRGNEMGSRRS